MKSHKEFVSPDDASAIVGQLAEALMVLARAGYAHSVICLVCQGVKKHTEVCWYGNALAKANTILEEK